MPGSPEELAEDDTKAVSHCLTRCFMMFPGEDISASVCRVIAYTLACRRVVGIQLIAIPGPVTYAEIVLRIWAWAQVCFRIGIDAGE